MLLVGTSSMTCLHAVAQLITFIIAVVSVWYSVMRWLVHSTALHA